MDILCLFAAPQSGSFVVGGMRTLSTLLVHEGDASFLAGHLLSACVMSALCGLYVASMWPMWLVMTHTFLQIDALNKRTFCLMLSWHLYEFFTCGTPFGVFSWEWLQLWTLMIK